MRFTIGLFLFLVFGRLTGQQYHFRPLPAFPDQEVMQVPVIFQSSDHMMWFGTNLGVFAFDGRKYKYIQRPDSVQALVTTIREGRTGEIWAGYQDGFLHTFNLHGVNRRVQADSIQGAGITSILFTDHEGVFITTYGKGIWQLRDHQLNRIRFEALAGMDDIYDAVLDRFDRIWMATDNGVWVYQAGREEKVISIGREKGLPDEIVTHLAEARNGDIWMGLYDHGLGLYEQGKDSVTMQLPLAAGQEHVTGLAGGRRNNVWLCTDRKLHNCFHRGECREIRLPPDIHDRLEHVYVDRNGHLWMAAGKHVFFVNTAMEFWPPGIEGIQAVAATRSDVWLGCDHGLYRLDKSTGRVTPFLEEEKINILSMYTDPDGILWIGTFGQGLYIFDPLTQRTHHLTEQDDISNNSILNIDGRDHTVWLATLGGVTEIQYTDDPIDDPLSLTAFQDQYDFPAGYVYDVHAGQEGNVWFGTDGNGLYVLEGDQLQNVSMRVDSILLTPEDLKTIYSITTGRDQSLWISAEKGKVVRVSNTGEAMLSWISSLGMPNSLLTSGQGDILMVSDGVVRARHPDSTFVFYTESAGLSGFTPHLNANVRDSDGSVWMAGTNRVLHYVSAPAGTRHQVRMHLESLTPDADETAGMIRLKPDSNFLDIRFAGLWYDDPGSVQYRYRLEGHDPAWIYTREGRAVYSRLSPGTYTFRVEGSHHDDFSNAESIQIKVQVLPPIYLRWWFVTGVILMTAGWVYWMLRARIKRINTLHQLEREKTMSQLHAIQAQVNPHFLFNSFNTLSSMIEEDQKAAVDYLDQLSGFFRGVLMHRHAELIRIDEELEIVRNYTYLLQKRYGDNLRIREDIQHTSGYIAPLSIQLLVENAIKHNTVSREKPLTISISVHDNRVSVSNPIQPKFHDATESTGFGLSSLLARYQYLAAGKIEILKDPNTFTVHIPIIHSDTPL